VLRVRVRVACAILLFASCGKSNGLQPSDDGGGKTVPPAATCAGSPVTAMEANSVDSISENVDTTCVSVVGYLPWKSGAAGDACTSPTDCAPVCVPCPSGAKHTLASWCDHGHCAAAGDVACMVLGSPLKSCGTAGGTGGANPPSATCTGAPIMNTEAKSADSISENVDTTCASVAGTLPWKMGTMGSACATPTDCSPVCVPCPNGTHHTLASWCSHGQCAAPGDVACMIQGTPGFASCSP
jgi:hypothetical protein